MLQIPHFPAGAGLRCTSTTMERFPRLRRITQMTDAAAAAPAPEGAQRASQAEATPASPPLSRREFLNYMWGASMAGFLAGAGGVTGWIALPRFGGGGVAGGLSGRV